MIKGNISRITIVTKEKTFVVVHLKLLEFLFIEICIEFLDLGLDLEDDTLDKMCCLLVQILLAVALINLESFFESVELTVDD